MALKRTVLAVWLPEPLTVATWIERSLTTFSFSGTGCVSVTSTWVIPIRLLWSSPLPKGRSRRSYLPGPELALKRARKLLRGPPQQELRNPQGTAKKRHLISRLSLSSRLRCLRARKASDTSSVAPIIYQMKPDPEVMPLAPALVHLQGHKRE